MSPLARTLSVSKRFGATWEGSRSRHHREAGLVVRRSWCRKRQFTSAPTIKECRGNSGLNGSRIESKQADTSTRYGLMDSSGAVRE